MYGALTTSLYFALGAHESPGGLFGLEAGREQSLQYWFKYVALTTPLYLLKDRRRKKEVRCAANKWPATVRWWV